MITIHCEDECGKTGNPVWFDQMVRDYVPEDRTVRHFFSTGQWGCVYKGNPIIFTETMQEPYVFLIKNFCVYQVEGRHLYNSYPVSDKLNVSKKSCGKLKLDVRKDHHYQYIGKFVHGLGLDLKFCTFLGDKDDFSNE